MAGLSGRELGRLARLAESHVQLIETGRRLRAEVGTVQALAHVLGISLDWLVDGKGETPTRESVIEAVRRAGGGVHDPTVSTGSSSRN